MGCVTDTSQSHLSTPEQVRNRIEEAWNSDYQNRKESRIDLEYLAGRQWTKEEEAARQKTNRPMLTFNRLPTFVQQVVNDIRQNKPSISIVPEEDEDKEVSEVYEGLIRQIEYKSGGPAIYAAPAADAVSSSIGFLRVKTDYVDEKSFDQEILIEHIIDPGSVYFDPYATRQDKSDADYMVVLENVSEEEFKRRFPGKDLDDVDEYESDYDHVIDWAEGENVKIAEYYEVRTEKGWLVGTDEGVSEATRQVAQQWEQAGAQVREVEKRTIWRCVVSGSQMLEEWELLPGKHMPIVAVVGSEIRLGSETVRTSLIRFARDPQKLYNYWRSSAAEAIGQAPKSKWLVTQKMIAKFKKSWGVANSSPSPYLQYEPDENAPGAMPKQIAPPAPPSAMWQESQIVVEDMKAVTGIFDASLGAGGNETSGKAIMARQREGDTSNYHYTDNLEKAIRRVGEILIDLIPKIYDNERIVRLIGEDGSEKTVTINQQVEDEDGIVQTLNDLRKGKYHVRVSTGPSYMTKRIESADSMMSFIQAVPQAGNVIADLIAKNMDWPGADNIADRLRKMVPPELLEHEGGEPRSDAPMPAGGPEMTKQPAQDGQPPQSPLAPPQDEAQGKLQDAMMQIQLQTATAKAEYEQNRAALEELKVEAQALENERAMNNRQETEMETINGY